MKLIIGLVGIILGLTSNVYAANSNVVLVPGFKGGLDEIAINRCNIAMEAVCNANDGLVQYIECAKNYFTSTPHCAQNLQLLEQERGFFDIVNLYGNVSVVKAKVYAADHSEDFFMIDSLGEFVRLTSQLDITKFAIYQTLNKKFNQISLWTTATALPEVKLGQAGELSFIFPQLLLNGCHACEQVGIAKIAYRFSSTGQYLGATVLEIIPTIGQSQV